MLARLRVLLPIVWLLGCKGGSTTDSPAPPPTVCDEGRELHDGICALRFDTCKDTEVPIAGGGCAPVGIPEGRCAKGFVRDVARATCEPILPKDPCPTGKIAVPGDATCRDLAPCGEGTWGSIPVEASTLYVDASYSGTDSDGTKSKPYTRIQVALAAAYDNEIIAIAAGTYEESLSMKKSARLYGRCPSMVTVKSPSSDPYVYALLLATSGEAHGIAITGLSGGIEINDASSVLVENVWVHDTAGRGISLAAGKINSHVTVKNTLIERSTGHGIFAALGDVVVENSAVRDVASTTDGLHGNGVHVQHVDRFGEPRETLTFRGGLVERMHGGGFSAHGASLTVEGTVVRDIDTYEGPGNGGWGILIEQDATGVGTLDVKSSLVAATRSAGIFVTKARAHVETTTVRDVLAKRSGVFGDGIEVGEGASLDLVDSVVERSRRVNVNVIGAKATLSNVLVRDSVTTHGVEVSSVDAADDGSIELHRVRVSGSKFGGIVVVGARAVIEGCAVFDTKPSEDKFGDGIAIGSLYNDAGVALLAEVEIARTLSQGNGRAGLSLFAATARLEDSLLSCNAFDIEVGRDMISPQKGDFSLVDSSGNVCGCGASVHRCRAASSGLSPVR